MKIPGGEFQTGPSGDSSYDETPRNAGSMTGNSAGRGSVPPRPGRARGKGIPRQGLGTRRRGIFRQIRLSILLVSSGRETVTWAFRARRPGLRKTAPSLYLEPWDGALPFVPWCRRPRSLSPWRTPGSRHRPGLRRENLWGPEMDTIRQIRAVVLLPGTVTLIVPALILWRTNSWNAFGALYQPLSIVALIAGLNLMVVGFVLWFRTVVLFREVGKGTLAPWDPPKRLVVRGIYRYVRNPMISGVCFFLAGETVLFGSLWLGVWLVGFFVINILYLPLVEEPGLIRRFGDDYRTYRQNVPRWIPRLTPWEPPWSAPG